MTLTASAQFSTPQIENFEKKMKIDKLSSGVWKHKSAVLSVIPVDGMEKNLANVSEKYNLYITNNGQVSCSDFVKTERYKGSGCVLSIYVSRRRASGNYSDLAGFHAMWFMGINETHFRPANGGADQIAMTGAMIQRGGLIDTHDRP